MTSATLAALESSLGPGAVEKIRNVVRRRASSEIVLNLVQLDLDGERAQATVRYFVEDPAYPEVTLSFEELEELLAGR